MLIGINLENIMLIKEYICKKKNLYAKEYILYGSIFVYAQKRQISRNREQTGSCLGLRGRTGIDWLGNGVLGVFWVFFFW